MCNQEKARRGRNQTAGRKLHSPPPQAPLDPLPVVVSELPRRFEFYFLIFHSAANAVRTPSKDKMSQLQGDAGSSGNSTVTQFDGIKQKAESKIRGSVGR